MGPLYRESLENWVAVLEGEVVGFWLSVKIHGGIQPTLLWTWLDPEVNPDVTGVFTEQRVNLGHWETTSILILNSTGFKIHYLAKLRKSFGFPIEECCLSILFLVILIELQVQTLTCRTSSLGAFKHKQQLSFVIVPIWARFWFHLFEAPVQILAPCTGPERILK